VARSRTGATGVVPVSPVGEPRRHDLLELLDRLTPTIVELTQAIEQEAEKCPEAQHLKRRTCAKLCHAGGGELEQIQFLLDHASVQTTERYLGCKQNLGHPVNDRFTLETCASLAA
jgi:integrase